MLQYIINVRKRVNDIVQLWIYKLFVEVKNLVWLRPLCTCHVPGLVQVRAGWKAGM